MKICFLPKNYLGKWSCGLIVAFAILLGIFFIFIALGERGGMTFFSNLKLTIPMVLASLSAITAFFIGLASLIKDKYKSVLVLLSTTIGFLILLWVLAEIVFPH